MSTEQKTQEQLEQAELADAMAKVAIAKAKILAAEQAKLDVAAEAVAQYKARLEREEAEKKAWSEAVAAKWAAKQKAEQDAQLAEQHAQIAAQRHLENEFNKAEEAKQKRLAAEKEIARQTALAFEAERTAKMLEQEVLRQALRQREQEAQRETEFSDDDGTLEPEQTTGIDTQAGGLESAAPGEWGTASLRRLFGRSEATAKETPAFIPNYTQDPQPLTNEEIKLNIDRIYGKAVVDAAVEHLKTLKGTNVLQTYLAANFKPINT